MTYSLEYKAIRHPDGDLSDPDNVRTKRIHDLESEEEVLGAARSVWLTAGEWGPTIVYPNGKRRLISKEEALPPENSEGES
jgi:hypothetical protein